MPAWLFLTFSIFMRCIASINTGSCIRLPVRFVLRVHASTASTGALLPVNVPVYGLLLPAGLAIVDLWASYHVGK